MSCNVHKFFRYIMGRWLICYCCRVEPFHIMNLPQSLDLWRIRKHVVTVINLLLSLRFLGNIHDTQTCDMSIWLLGSTRVPSLYRSFFLCKIYIAHLVALEFGRAVASYVRALDGPHSVDNVHTMRQHLSSPCFLCNLFFNQSARNLIDIQ